MKKILIAGTNSGVGKTTISLGIMMALKQRNLKVQPYKVGPDYIDPSYHTFITKRDSRNLDSYMLDDDMVKYIFKNASIDSDISVIEGVMGLYDGLGTDINNCTSSYTSKILKAPVILVINGAAMAASSAAMVLGYKQIDRDVNIKGIIVNNVKTQSHFELIKNSIEEYCNIEVLGYFPPNNKYSLESRHLGLVPSIEMDSLNEKFMDLGNDIEKYINIDRLLEIAQSEDIDTSFEIDTSFKIENKILALAYDKAFNFYYKENIDLLEKLGIKIVKFSPIEDKYLPKCDYVYIGGGFPEIFAKELENNHSMRQSIKDAHENNIPIYAECGGLMYLGELLEDKDESYQMVGIFKGKSVMTKSLKRFGYCSGEANFNTILSNEGDIIKGHEFHHSEFVTEEKTAYLMKKQRGQQTIQTWGGGYSKNNTLASYLHIHFYTNINAVKNFLSKGID